MDEKKINLEETFDELFQSTTAEGDEELIKIASTYTRQISGYQLKLILFLKYISYEYEDIEKARIEDFINTWIELKQYNNSANFIARVIDSIALKRLITDKSVKINIDKK